MDPLDWASTEQLLDRWIADKSRPDNPIPAGQLPRETQDVASFDSANLWAEECRAELDGYTYAPKRQRTYGAFCLNSLTADVDHTHETTVCA